jgi:magnesium-transporting ATPase (P-type)
VWEELLSMDEGDDQTDSYKGILKRTVVNFATQAYRTILITYKDMSMDAYNDLMNENNNFATEKDKEVLECDLTAVCIFGIQDPLRPTIVDSI